MGERRKGYEPKVYTSEQSEAYRKAKEESRRTSRRIQRKAAYQKRKQDGILSGLESKERETCK